MYTYQVKFESHDEQKAAIEKLRALGWAGAGCMDTSFYPYLLLETEIKRIGGNDVYRSNFGQLITIAEFERQFLGENKPYQVYFEDHCVQIEVMEELERAGWANHGSSMKENFFPWLVLREEGKELAGNDDPKSHYQTLTIPQLREKFLVNINKKSKMKSFQVNTLGVPEVKRLLVKLWEKQTGRTAAFVSYECRDCEFLQFWYADSCEDRWNVTHNPTAYKNYEVLSIEDAIKRLGEVLKPTEKLVKLNREYTATVTRGSDTVKVGYQSIPVSAVKELHAAILEMEKE